MSQFFWAEAVSCAVYLINRSPTKILNNHRPHEDDGETHGSTGADDHPDSPIRKTRSLRELYDVTDEIENNEVRYYKTEDQMAYIFTKPLSRQVFEKRYKLGSNEQI